MCVSMLQYFWHGRVLLFVLLLCKYYGNILWQINTTYTNSIHDKYSQNYNVSMIFLLLLFGS